MSYARWGSSNWYAFYNTNSGDTIDDQTLSLWYSLDDLKDWSYADLKDIDEKWVIDNYGDISEEDIEEALNIIKMFRKDCEEDFT
jgi:hypothetical protein